MSNRKSEYDRNSETLWVDWTDVSGQHLIDREALRPFVEILRDGQQGPDPVSKVNFVFEDEGCARYNHDSLKFSRIGTWLLHSGVRRPLNAANSPDFDVREDFGMKR